MVEVALHAALHVRLAVLIILQLSALSGISVALDRDTRRGVEERVKPHMLG
ncbi:MAG: hypothetical protein OWQ48_04215 [Desulfurococcus sp.]|nr:hypothetical protein [Desulfurococcus sp.]